MNVDEGICRIASPIFAIFAVQPQSSAAAVLVNSWWTASLQISALKLCAYLARHLLRKRSLSPLVVQLTLSFFVSHNKDFLEKDCGANQM